MRFWIVLSALLAFAAALPHTQEQDEILQKVMQYLSNARMNDADPEEPSQQTMQQQIAVQRAEPSDAPRTQVQQQSYDYATHQQEEESDFQLVYALDMTDPDQSCPKSLKLNTHGKRRLCGKKTAGSGCDSITISTNGQSYKEVRGRVVGYQYASPDAFHSGSSSIDGVYVDGVSITHGRSPRKHVWTLGASVYSYKNSDVTCPGTGYGRPQPAFVGNNYFCTSGNLDPKGWERRFYDVPLWSTVTGNCGHCNSVYDVPYFCTTLPQSTTDNLELRVCANQELSDEDILLESIELYIKA